MIFKIQQPISSNMPTNELEALIYNRDRSIEFAVPMAGMKQFWIDAGDRARVYVEAELDEDEGFCIEAFVEDQPW